jgi:uncharacterized membrane protein required for colicin V production
MNVLNNLPFNWFDVVAVAVLIAGFFRGRKRGMSEELLPMIQWLIIIFGGAALYEPLGGLLADMLPVSRLFCYVTAYILIAVLTKACFALIKHLLKGKLIGSDVFGKTEYYLGMMAGMIRFACGLLAVLAVLNARLYTKQEIIADRRYQIQQFDNEFFPKLYTLQEQVFEASALGPRIREAFEPLLIKPTPPENRSVRRPGEWSPTNP